MLQRRQDSLALFARFPPHWNHIEPLRQYVDVCVRARTRNGAAERAGIVVQELLENAVKYGDPASEIEMEVHMSDTGQGIDVRVANKAHPSRVAILEREFTRTKNDTAPAAFARALQRLQRLPEGTTMLGLARIAMDAALQMEVDGDRVVITARVEARYNGGPPSSGTR